MSKVNDTLGVIRPSVRKLRPYHLQERSCRIKLNQNESPYDLPRALKQEIMHAFIDRPWNRYPSFTPHGLKRKLAGYLSISEDCLLIGNGSNDLLNLLFASVLPSRSKVLIVEPTFSIYRQLARISEASLLELCLNDDFDFPVRKILSALDLDRADLCLLCSPNSPTGTLLPKDALQKILSKTSGIVLVDEAYHEFAGTNYLDLVRTSENLLVSRTFSKALGLAGLRLGYFVGPPDLIREIGKAKLPYNLNIFSEFVATRVLDQRDLIQSRVSAILQERDNLYQGLSEIPGLQAYPSYANFLMVESRLPAVELFAKLAKRGILVRDISKQHPMLGNKLRITVGKPEENVELVVALQEILGVETVKERENE